MVSNNLNIPNLQNNKDLNFQEYPSMGTAPIGDASGLRKRANASKDSNPLALGATALGSWYVLNQGMDRFNASCNKANYADTAYGKIDKFTNNVKELILGKQDKRNFLGRGVDKLDNWWKGYRANTLEKNPVAKALLNESADPEWGPVKMQKDGIKSISKIDTHQVFQQFLEPSVKLDGNGNVKSFNARKLEQYFTWDPKFANLTADEYFAKELDGLNNLLPDKAKHAVFSKGATAEQKLNIITELKHRVLGIDPKNAKEGIEKLADDIYKDPQAFAKKNKKLMNLNFSIWKGKNKISSHLFGRNVGFCEIINKATVASKGSMLSKLMAYLQEGTTSRFGGGKLACAFMAFFFGDMLYSAFTAPKGEKGKTLAERFVHDQTYFIGMPFALMALYKLGGMQFIGTTKEEYMKELNAHNKLRKEGGFATKKEADAAYKALREKFKPKGFFNKLCWSLGNFIDIGNSTKEAWQKKDGSVVGNWFRKVFSSKTAKNFIGAPMRFIIPMMVLVPWLVKRTVGAEHAIFGKPTKSILDEEDSSKEQELSPEQEAFIRQQMQQQMVMQQQAMNQQNGAMNNNPYYQNPQMQQNIPQQPMAMNNNPYQQMPQQMGMPQQNQQQYNNVQNQVAMNNQVQNVNTQQTNKQQNDSNKAMEPKRTYVPSPFGMVKPTQKDMSGLNAAMMEADKAEKMAQSILAM